MSLQSAFTHEQQPGPGNMMTHMTGWHSPACWRVRAEALELRLPADSAAAPPSEQLQLTARAPPASLQLLSTNAGFWESAWSSSKICDVCSETGPSVGL